VSAAALTDIVEFLRRYPPFDALAPEDLERVAAATEVEFHPIGSTIFEQGQAPVRHLRMVRSGAVEIVYEGRVLDLGGEYRSITSVQRNSARRHPVTLYEMLFRAYQSDVHR
jgi:signal-transduction protein with cAMP-binding, CBS, and nucleotidyltransferase domain